MSQSQETEDISPKIQSDQLLEDFLEDQDYFFQGNWFKFHFETFVILLNDV